MYLKFSLLLSWFYVSHFSRCVIRWIGFMVDQHGLCRRPASCPCLLVSCSQLFVSAILKGHFDEKSQLLSRLHSLFRFFFFLNHQIEERVCFCWFFCLFFGSQIYILKLCQVKIVIPNNLLLSCCRLYFCYCGKLHWNTEALSFLEIWLGTLWNYYCSFGSNKDYRCSLDLCGKC